MLSSCRNLITANLSGCVIIIQKNYKINRLHERCLRLLYNDKKSSFEDLLQKDNSVSIHQRNLRALAVEMYRIKNGLAPEIVAEISIESKRSIKIGRIL